MRNRVLCAALLLLITGIVQAGGPHEPRQYRIEKLEGIGGFPTEINRHGAITGQGFALPQGPVFPFLWTRKRSIILTAEPPTFALVGHGVNDKGQVVGTLVASDPERTRGFVWTRGRFVEIGDLPGGNSVSVAEDINNVGQVAGESHSAEGTECILWERGNLMSIGDLPGGAVNCAGFAINRSGDIVGLGEVQGSLIRPFLWREGTMTELPLPPDASQGFAVDINKSGVVVGNFFGSDRSGAIVWSNDEITLLPGLQGLIPNANGMNDRGDIVGSVSDFAAFSIPVLWHDGVAVNLNDLVPANDPLKSCASLLVAQAINNRGEIAALGLDECVTPSPPSIYRLVPVKGKGRK
jgi:probable HAF family extracellular repeat protein